MCVSQSRQPSIAVSRGMTGPVGKKDYSLGGCAADLHDRAVRKLLVVAGEM